VSDFIKNKISVSMVAVFPHGGQDISKMRSIASVTGGRYYIPSDPAQLPSILIKESKTLKRSMIQNETLTPEVGYPSGILRGVDALPPLHGYVLTTAKSRSENILNTPPKEGGDGEIDPILSKWKYGLGTTAAFTSDLSPNWGKDWMQWDKYRAFVKQLLTDISRVHKEGHLRMWSYASGNEGVVVVEDFHPQESFLEVRARVSGPRNQSETIALKQVGPRRYRATVPLWGKGRYQVTAVGVAGDREDRAVGGIIVPYSPEYLRFRSNPIVLDEIKDKTGGENLADLPDATSRANVIYGRRDPKKSSRPIFDWFLIALACCIPIDVAIRRIQLDLYVIKGWLGLGQRRPESTRTMGALLERKQAVDSQLDAKRREQPSVSARPVQPKKQQTAQRETPRKHQPTEQQDVPQIDEDKLSTTERLLAMKRKRHDD
jgi:hypothetical protein